MIELMVVIALVGIAAVMIVPEMKGSYEDAVLRSASRELLNVCQLAYSRAVSHNQVHRVRIDEASGRYLIEVLSGGAGREPQFRPVKEMRDSKGEIDPRITVRVRTPGDTEAKSFPGSSGDQESTEPGLLVFYGDGTADSREVWLQGGHGFGIVLSVNPVTARVRVSELARR